METCADDGPDRIIAARPCRQLVGKRQQSLGRRHLAGSQFRKTVEEQTAQIIAGLSILSVSRHRGIIEIVVEYVRRPQPDGGIFHGS